MTFLEYKTREGDIINSHHNGSITRDVMYKLLEDNRKAYNECQDRRERNRPTSTFPNWTSRAEEALAKMKAKQAKVGGWAKARISEDGENVLIVKGSLLLATLSILEARLLAAQILSLTNPKIKRS